MEKQYINPNTTHILIKHNEISLKGRNRPFFENRLRTNIGRVIGQAGKIRRLSDRVLIELPTSADTALYKKVIDKVTNIGGIVSVSPCRLTTPNLENLEKDTVSWATEDLRERPDVKTFAVRTRRADKNFPMKSNDVDRHLGSRVKRLKDGLTTNLKRPDLKISVEIRDKHALIYSSEAKGICGLPLDKTEKVVCLLSGGIDSPVAAHEIMRRGCVPIFVHFHSKPFTSEKSIMKVKRLAAKVQENSPYPLDFWMVPLFKIQKAVKEICNERHRTVHYRRFMMRLAQEIAYREGAKAMVTGDALGQVASQTLTNMLAIEEVTRIPILRPLVSLDKAQIIEKSKAIGTFDISIEPHDDACVLFAPDRPATQAKSDTLNEEDQNLPMYELIFEALDQAEKIKIEN